MYIKAGKKWVVLVSKGCFLFFCRLAGQIDARSWTSTKIEYTSDGAVTFQHLIYSSDRSRNMESFVGLPSRW